MPAPTHPQSFTRKCATDTCDRILRYVRESSRDAAEKKGTICQKCVSTYHNGFKGRKHTEATKKVQSALRKQYFDELDEDTYQAFVEKMSVASKAVAASRPQLSNYEYWVIRYGKEEADIRHAASAVKKSIASSGSKNPMYGRPSPSGSGVGWKGWYRGTFFRSLRELSFLIGHPEAESGERNEWRAHYTWNGRERTTVPDFLLHETREVIECKPAKLHDSPLVSAKRAALESLIESRGYSYVLLDPGVIQLDLLDSLIESNDVALTEKTKERVHQWRLNLS